MWKIHCPCIYNENSILKNFVINVRDLSEVNTNHLHMKTRTIIKKHLVLCFIPVDVVLAISVNIFLFLSFLCHTLHLPIHFYNSGIDYANICISFLLWSHATQSTIHMQHRRNYIFSGYKLYFNINIRPYLLLLQALTQTLPRFQLSLFISYNTMHI